MTSTINKSSTVTRIFAGTAIIAALVAPSLYASDKDVSAARATDLNDWSQKSSAIVDQVMYWPHLPTKAGKDGSNVFKVTVNENGDVTGLDIVSSQGSPLIKSHSKRLIKKMDLPDLPRGYKDLTFTLEMNFIADPTYDEIRNSSRTKKVTTDQVAKNGTTGDVSAVSIGILSASVIK